jgi:O-antigen ligase
MPHLDPSLTKKLHPLRYWIFVVYAVGLPNFVKFDGSGRTHKQGLFNTASILSIALTLLTGFLLATMTLLNRHRIMRRKIHVSSALWIVLLLNLAIASFLQPASHLTPYKMTDIPLSLYRLGEWVLAFVLLVSLYTREKAENATDLIIRLIASVCWANILIVWVALPVLPSLVYATPGDDTAGGHPRLGGLMIHPGHLSVLAGVAFFHALIFMRGPKRAAACSLAFLTLILTYGRSELGVLLVVLAIYVLVLSRSALLRWFGLLGGVSLLAVAVALHEKVLKYLERGHGMRTITTLSERTLVWKASFDAFIERPYIGYGFIAGPRNAILDHWTSPNWIPPHAHNEFLQALLSGGILAGVLVSAIYGRACWAAIRGANQGMRQIFLLIVLVQITLMAFTMPLITIQISRVSALFLLTFIGVVAPEQQRVASKVTEISEPRNRPALEWVRQA